MEGQDVSAFDLCEEARHFDHSLDLHPTITIDQRSIRYVEYRPL